MKNKFYSVIFKERFQDIINNPYNLNILLQILTKIFILDYDYSQTYISTEFIFDLFINQYQVNRIQELDDED